MLVVPMCSSKGGCDDKDEMAAQDDIISCLQEGELQLLPMGVCSVPFLLLLRRDGSKMHQILLLFVLSSAKWAARTQAESFL